MGEWQIFGPISTYVLSLLFINLCVVSIICSTFCWFFFLPVRFSFPICDQHYVMQPKAFSSAHLDAGAGALAFLFSTAYSTVVSATYCAAWRNGKMLLISRAEYLAQVAETIWRSMIENSFLYQATSYQQLLETLMNFSVQIKYAMYDSVLVRQ